MKLFKKVLTAFCLSILWICLFSIFPTKSFALPGSVLEMGFSEGNGTTVSDSSGSNNNGTISGAVWESNGKFGSALSFDGLNDLVTIADANSLDLTNNITLEAWVKPTTTSSNYRTIIMKERPSNATYTLYSNSNNNRPMGEHSKTSGAVVDIKGTTQLPANTWSHIAVTYNGAQFKFFLNGVQKASKNTTGAMFVSNGALRIGGNSIWSDEYFSGLIDEVRIYNRALTAAEITTDMNTPITQDTTNPTISITSPTQGATISGTQIITANAQDNISVAGVQFKVDGQNVGTEDTSAPYAFSWNTTSATNADHIITAVARDSSQNTTTSSPITITVSNPPTLTISSPSENQNIVGNNITITYTKSGDLTYANHAHFVLDGGATKMDLDFDGTYTISNVAPGNHTLVGMIARSDHSEIELSEDTVSFTTTVPDTTNPVVDIISPEEGSIVSGTTTLTAVATDNIAISGVQFKVNNQNVGAQDTTFPYQVSWNSTTVSNGTYTLTAIATDTSQNATSSAQISITVQNADPRAQIGQWSGIMNWPLVAVHSTFLNTGKILVWDAWEYNTTTAKLWDYQTNTFSQVPNSSQLFCAAHTTLADGRVLVTGGHNGGEIGIKDTNIFSPETGNWNRPPDMQYARWYPSNVTLGDGRVVVLSGQITGGTFADIPELYNPITNTWSTLNVNTSSMRDSEYPLTFLLPNGKIYTIAATPGNSYTLDVATPQWTNVGTIPSKLGSAAMYRPGKILYTGGGDIKDSGQASRNQASVIDMTAATPTWSTVASMAYPRYQHNLTILADGTVMAIGGASIVSQTATSGTLPTEIWDPTTQLWSTTASIAQSRNYHSTAMLLPDGRVLSAGGGRLGGAPDRFTAQIYSPPYLFKGTRPVINTAPTNTGYGEQMSLLTSDTTNISKVAFVPLASNTHTLDMNQRYVELNFTKTTNQITVDSPTDFNIAPPGYYMVFIINNLGVPSEAKIVKLNTLNDTTFPTASITSPTQNATVVGSITITAQAADNIAVAQTQFTLDGNNIGSPDTSVPYEFTWDTTTSSNGIHLLSVKATDTFGNTTTSDDVSVTVDNPVDTTAPIITNVLSSNISGTTATISWTTNENADTQVEYGTTTAYGSNTTLNPVLSTTHSQSLSGLTSNTQYQYRVKSKDANGNLTTSDNMTFTTTGNLATINFNDHPQTDVSLNGIFPTGLINWGTNQWFISGPWGQFTTKSISFNSASQTTATFNFVTPKILSQLDMYNGGANGTTTIACTGNTTKSVSINASQILTNISTGFTTPCTTVTFTSSNGWNTNYDNFVVTD